MLAWSLACTTEIVRFTRGDGAIVAISEGGTPARDVAEDAGPRPDSGAGDRQDADALDDDARDGASDTKAATELRYRYLEYSCCKPDAAGECLVAPIMGSNSSCKDVATWKEYAFVSCQDMGTTLGLYGVYVACTSEITEPGAAPAPACFFTEMRERRCRVCDDGVRASPTYCETLTCKPASESSGTKCDECVWSNHPSSPCLTCVDGATGKLVSDSCRGQSPPE